MQEAIAAAPSRPRLAFVDGLRGIAALYVVLFHAYLEVTWKDGGAGISKTWIGVPSRFLRFGYLSVVVFIALSGFCLMLPVVSSGGGVIKGGLFSYFTRRARRILPPYYVALVLSLGLLAVSPIGRPTGERFDYALPAFKLDTVLSHAALIHNWSPDWNRKINPPMWSIAVEWQIYFLFPLLLLPIWRRFGLIALVAAGCLIGMAPAFLGSDRLEMSSPWFVGVFAMGMAAAAVGRPSGRRLESFLSRRVPWGAAALAGWLLVLWICLRSPELTGGYWKTDFVVGMATCCLLVYGVKRGIVSEDHSAHDRPRRIRSIPFGLLNSRPLVGLGLFSYSLYLIHSPLLALSTYYMNRLGVSQATCLAILVSVVTPLILLVSYGFYRAFERPFLVPANRAKIKGSRRWGEDLGAVGRHTDQPVERLGVSAHAPAELGR